MRSLFLLVSLATSVHAQVGPPPPTVEDGVLLAIAVSGTGLAAATVVGPSYAPLPMTVALFGTSSALGLRPSVPGILLDAAVGFGAGMIAGHLYLDTASGGWREVEALMVGGAAGAMTASTAHVLRLHWLRSDRVALTPVVSAGGQGAALRVVVDL